MVPMPQCLFVVPSAEGDCNPFTDKFRPLVDGNSELIGMTLGLFEVVVLGLGALDEFDKFEG